MFGNDTIDYAVLAVLVVVGLAGVFTYFRGVQRAKRA
jgi:Flp pilus assembly pilin Flp